MVHAFVSRRRKALEHMATVYYDYRWARARWGRRGYTGVGLLARVHASLSLRINFGIVVKTDPQKMTTIICSRLNHDKS
jgi:hypothetical protein